MTGFELYAELLVSPISHHDFDTNFEPILFYDIKLLLIYSPISHLSPENLDKHRHFPVYLSQIWSVVLSSGQLQAVEKPRTKRYDLDSY